MTSIPKLTAKPLSMASKHRYNTVKILSIQECDNKIKIVKMVRRKRPRLLPSLSSTINIEISDDEEKENVIEIPDSDDEKENSSKILKLGEKFKNLEKSPKNSPIIIQNSPNLQKTLKCSKNSQNLQKSPTNSENSPSLHKSRDLQKSPDIHNSPKQSPNPQKSQEKSQNVQKSPENSPNSQNSLRVTENSPNLQSSVQISKISEIVQKSSLMILTATSLGDSTNIFMQNLLTQFKNDQKSSQQRFMENFNLKLSENDSNNNLPLTPPPESPENQPTEYLAKLKCHRTCYLSKMHQKKHRADISSEIGILLTRRDSIDGIYHKNSLKKIEDYSKAPKVDKFDKFIHATRNGAISKSPKGRFGRKIQASDILAMMKDAGRERNVIMKWGKGRF